MWNVAKKYSYKEEKNRNVLIPEARLQENMNSVRHESPEINGFTCITNCKSGLLKSSFRFGI